MDEFKKVTREQAEEFAEVFFGGGVEMENSPLDEFVFRVGVVTLKVFKNYGRAGETSYPFEHPFGQIFVNEYVVAGVLFVKKGKKYIVQNILPKAS